MKQIVVMTPEQAVTVLRKHGLGMATVTLRRGLEQGKYPFGECVVQERQNVYHIYRRQLEEWIAEREMDVEEVSV